MHIVFNKPSIGGDELNYISDVIHSGKLAGNSKYTKACHEFFQENYGYKKCLLTTSCTDALEIAALLAGVGPGDEVIIPSYTFVSTANPFLLRGADIVFADSTEAHPNLDISAVEKLITERTRAIVPVHYAGVACDMDALMELAARHRLLVIEDAAQGIHASYKGRPLGSIGHLGAMSFHETKNVTSGEGGMLFVNDDRFTQRADIIWEKGTNRSAFFRGEVEKYGWVDIGSSFLPSELNAAFLYSQLLRIGEIHARRMQLWKRYYDLLLPLHMQGHLNINSIPEYATQNAHIFYICTNSGESRDCLLEFLLKQGIQASFHYLQLHQGPYFLQHHAPAHLPNADKFTKCLLRLPLFPDLSQEEVTMVCRKIYEFYQAQWQESHKPELQAYQVGD